MLPYAGDSASDEEDKAAGTTATVALVRRDKIVVANVGDSRAVLSRSGQAVDLTHEHRCCTRVLTGRVGGRLNADA